MSAVKRAGDGLDGQIGKKLCIDIADITCPITKEIFYMPVLADDGFTYERWAIDQHMQAGRSPLTREPIKSYTDNIVVKNMIAKVLDENPELKSEQFLPDTYYNFPQNKKGWMKVLSGKNFEEFSKFNEIQLLDKASDNYRSMLVIEYVCEHCTNVETFRTIISKAIDVNCFHNSHSPMFYVASSKNKDIIISATDTEMNIANISDNDNEDLITVIMNNRYLSVDDRNYILSYIIGSKRILDVFGHKPMCLVTLTDTEHFSNSILQIIADPKAIQKLIDIEVLTRLYLDDSIKIIDLLESVEINRDDVYRYYKDKYANKNKNEFTQINRMLRQCYDKIKSSNTFDVNFKKAITAKLHQFYKNKIGIDAIDDILLLDDLARAKSNLDDNKRICFELSKEICG
jgi:hypothetical protein